MRAKYLYAVVLIQAMYRGHLARKLADGRRQALQALEKTASRADAVSDDAAEVESSTIDVRHARYQF